MEFAPKIQNAVPSHQALDELARLILKSELEQLNIASVCDLDRHVLIQNERLPRYLIKWLGVCFQFLEGMKSQPVDELWAQWHINMPEWSTHSEYSAKANLYDACLKAIPAILKGRVRPQEVLFPKGSLSLVEGVYKNNPVSDYFNGVLIEAVIAAIESQATGTRSLRILEIGAGTGGTTAPLLQALKTWQESIEDYWYTDVSQTFLQHGKQQFKPLVRSFKTALFNVSDAPEQQGIPHNYFDVVIATNVIHATPNICQAIRNAKATLKPSGLIILNEISKASFFTHVTFGLLAGWWLFEDESLRINGCPGLSPNNWEKVLTQEGFSPVLFPAAKAHVLGQQIVVAQSDGVVRQTLKTPILKAKSSIIKVADNQSANTAEKCEIQQDQLNWHVQVETFLKQLVSKTLKIPEHKLQRQRRLEDYGLDSILVVQLTNAFNEYFESVDSSIFFEVPTLAALVDYFVEHYGEKLTGVLNKEKHADPFIKSSQKPMPPKAIQKLNTLKQTPVNTENKHPSNKTLSKEKGEARDSVEESEIQKIAVIGVAGRYPQAETKEAFWKKLMEGYCAIGEIPASRWEWQRYYDSEKGKEGHCYTRYGSFLDGVDCFDPGFFKVSRREAEKMDPQARLFLEEAYHCIEDAGYNPMMLNKKGSVGVFVGAMNSGYHSNSHFWSIANRVSYHFDLSGPSMAIDTACSSALSAIHLAINSLKQGECELAVAGGVNLVVNPNHLINLSEMMMLSEGNRCSVFSDSADGFVDAEAVGALLLKPLHKAEIEGDHIYAVIRGSAVNAGGHTNGYTVPSASAQAKLITSALQCARVDASELSYIEAHGTGTSLGDPIELSGLKRAFESSQYGLKNTCALGSVKSNIGHSESAAGIVGMTKLLMQFQHKTLVPSVFAEPFNPKLNIEQSPFYIQTKLSNWTVTTDKRVAAISSFGAGGANASVVLEEHVPNQVPISIESKSALIPISARTPEALRSLALNLHEYLNQEDIALNLSDIAYTLQMGRAELAHRLVFKVDSIEALKANLSKWIVGETENLEFWSGEVDVHEDTLVDILGENDWGSIVFHWAETGQFKKLAALWVKGGAIDWTVLYSTKSAQPKRVPLPGYPFAKESYWAPTLAHPEPRSIDNENSTNLDSAKCINNIKNANNFVNTNSTTALQNDPLESVAIDGAQASSKGLTYVPIWKVAPLKNTARTSLEGIHLLVQLGKNTDQQQLIDKIRNQLDIQGQCIRVQFREGQTEAIANTHWVCASSDEKGIDLILDSLPKINRVIVISPDQDSEALSHALMKNVNQYELNALKLFKALQNRLGEDAVLDIYSISIGRYPFSGESTPSNFIGAGLTGLGFALVQSDFRMRLRQIDLDSDWSSSADSLYQLFNEPPAERGELVKWSRGQRFLQALAPTELLEESSAKLKQEGVYVILGGSGTIGRIISRQLIEKYHAKVIWIGRSSKEKHHIQEALKSQIFAGKLDYIQADATQLDSLQQAVTQIIKQEGSIQGAIFSGMVFDFENSIQETTETRFQEILNVKVLGSINFYQAFKHLSLDFLCYFSSGQGFAFSGAAKVAAYATGITFADVFADALRTQSKFPVGVINWGFWQASLKERAISNNMDALTDQEGFACFETFTSALCQNQLYRILCIKAPPAVQNLMQLTEETYQLTASNVQTLPVPQAVLDQDYLNHLQAVFDPTQLDRSIVQIAYLQLQSMGIFQKAVPQTVDALMQQAGIIDAYSRWFDECLSILIEHGLVIAESGNYRVSKILDHVQRAAILSDWQKQRSRYMEDPSRRIQVALLDDCLHQLPDILRGQLQATDVLFPSGSMAKVEGIYKNNQLSDFFNDQLANRLDDFISALISRRPDCSIRILEVGAGTGGTTARVLPKLDQYARYIGEYCYTDLSKAFLDHGNNTFSKGRSYFNTDRLDISTGPISWVDIAGQYDVVIATNVLHATSNIVQTLKHAKTFLKQGGLLLLNELNSKTTAATLSFGLLSGWWLYEDESLRIPGSPLIDEMTWESLLLHLGFSKVVRHVQQGALLGQQIISAHSDGMILSEPTQATDSIVGFNKHTQAILESADLTENTIKKPLVNSVEKHTSHLDFSDSIEAKLMKVMKTALATSLKADPETLQPKIPFSDYGVDSILGVGFVKQLNQILGLELNSAILFEYASLVKLSTYLMKHYATQIRSYFQQSITDASKLECQSENTIKIAQTVNEAQYALPDQQPLVNNKSISKVSSGQSVKIAVVGMSVQCPGADNAEELWDLILHNRNSVEILPKHYLNPSFYQDEYEPGKSYCNKAGILKDRDCFDPLFFNLTPHEAMSMTPHQRLVLQESWKALEDAGINPVKLAGQNVSLYVGNEPGDYYRDSFTGGSEAIIASRLSYFLDLRGPAMVINTGCSSSGVAIHQACESLRRGESEMSIAGGVYALLDQEGMIRLAEIKMLSRSGQCHSFDAEADGTVISEGVGMVVLKRLEDAEAAGDSIYGIIEASGVNQDGASNGITAPNGESQEQLIRDTYKKFQINQEDIGYIEAHGTGTRLGDPIEANALIRAFDTGLNGSHATALGSIKANIGHTASAAGVIGLIKVLMCLKERKIPGLYGFKHLNPDINLNQTPIYINTQAKDWPISSGQRRMAAINSFGHSGTNSHLVVSEYVPVHSELKKVNLFAGDIVRLIVISAKTKESLDDYLKALLHWLEKPNHNLNTELQTVAYTLQTARESMRHRAAFIAKNLEELKLQLINRVNNGSESNLTESDVTSIAQQWLSGSEVNWNDYWPKSHSNKRCHLPVYPFAKERYWIKMPDSIPSEMPMARNQQLQASSKVKSFQKERVVSNEEARLVFSEPAWLVPRQNGKIRTGRCHLILIDVAKAHAQMLKASLEKRNLAPIVNHLTASGITQATRYQALTNELIQLVQSTQNLERIELIIASKKTESRLLIGLNALLRTASLELSIESRCLWIPTHTKGLTQQQLMHIAEKIQYSPATNSPLLSLQSKGVWAEWRWQELIDHEQRLNDLKSKGPITDWQDSGVYVITGGMGGIGLACAKAISEQCQGVHLYLLGRSKQDERIQTTLLGLQKVGAMAKYASVDLADMHQVRGFISNVIQQHGVINGILHCAGLNRDRLLLSKTPKDIQDVYAAKVVGTENLHIATQKIPLEFFTLFSSCSAEWGSVGQADYACANAFMDQFAMIRNEWVQQGECFGRTLSINFPYWAEGGMQLSEESVAEMERHTGMTPMTTELGIASLQVAINLDIDRLMIVEGYKEKISEWIYGDNKEERSEESEINVVEPIHAPVKENSTIKISGVSLNVEDEKHMQKSFEVLVLAVVDRLTQVFCSITLMPIDRVDPQEPLENYGIDSIMITRLNRALENEFTNSELLESLPLEARQLSKTLFFEYQTLNDIARYISVTYEDACRLWIGSGTSNKSVNVDAQAGLQAVSPENHTSSESKMISSKTHKCRDLQSEPTAVIGMSGRYPQASDLEHFWKNLAEGRDSVGEIPDERWSLRNFYVDSVKEAVRTGKSYCKWGGFIEGFADFDPLFFNISPREALNIDPQERLFLQSCWHALEDAGITKQDLAIMYDGNIGIFAGITKTGYGLYGPSLREQGQMVFPRTSFSSTANRVSYLLNLKGPSEPVDTMCSSSLTAIHQACESLRRGECQMAIAGGVNLYLHPSNYVELCAGQMLSKDGRCRSFGKGGNGFVPGEGVGTLLLKPLSQAMADRDPIHAVIRGTAVNHGGKTNGYTVPNPLAQADVIRMALDQSNISADQISYIEAHGTGTELGDPIEVTGLTQAFAKDKVEQRHCALGSAKSNIGHLEAAAGVAGVTKVILQLKHKQLVPSLHASELNPDLRLDTTPFYLQQNLNEWEQPDSDSRIAGVSSFGAGGANAHVIIEEFDEYRPAPSSAEKEVFLLSARDSERLQDYAKALKSFVAADPDMPQLTFTNLAYTLQNGREMMAARVGFIADSPNTLLEMLDKFLNGKAEGVEGIYYGKVPRNRLLQIADEDLSKTLVQWAEKGKWNKILELWIVGETIDWSAIHDHREGAKPYRISVPVYPFAKRRFWPAGRSADTEWVSDIRLDRNDLDVRKPENSIEKSISIQPEADQKIPLEKNHQIDSCSYASHWEAIVDTDYTKPAMHRNVLIVAGSENEDLVESLIGLYKLDNQSNEEFNSVFWLIPSNENRQVEQDRWLINVKSDNLFHVFLNHVPDFDAFYFIGETSDTSDWNAVIERSDFNEFLLLKTIKWLKQQNFKQSIDTYLVSQNNYRLSSEMTSAVGGGLTGMGYAIAQGEHRFKVRNIDVNLQEWSTPEELSDLAKRIQEEPGLPRGDVIKLSSKGRYSQKISQLVWDSDSEKSNELTETIREGGVYVILGGSGTVGGVISRFLLSDYKAKVIWFGRRPEEDSSVQKRIAECKGKINGKASDVSLDYLQADALDLESLKEAVDTVKQRYGNIDGAIFSGVVFSYENPITQITNSQFNEVFEMKSKGSIRFYQAFEHESLDFLCYFSSGQNFAFSGAAKLGPYAAGITFSDAFVRSVGLQSRFPIGTINWGFWHSSLNNLENKDVSSLPLSQHAGALEDRQGFECFVKFVEALRLGRLGQILCMSATKAVKSLMPLVDTPKNISVDQYLKNREAFEFAQKEAPNLLSLYDSQRFDRIMAEKLWVVLGSLGILRNANQYEEQEGLWRKSGILRSYRRWWDCSLDVLQRAGLIERQGLKITAVQNLTDFETNKIQERWHALKNEYLSNKERKIQIELIDCCFEDLSQILVGKRLATDSVFPNSSMRRVEGLYKNNALSDYFNQVVTHSVISQIKLLVQNNPEKPIRIIEVGAGTGGTTAVVLDALKQAKYTPAEYCYTDVSKAFLMHAQKEYGKDNKFLTYKIWDVQTPAKTQGIKNNYFDILIAANVLHATDNIENTLSNVQSVLTSNSAIILNEISHFSLFSHLTFGLLKGWWLYEDSEIRIPGTPAISPENWAFALKKIDFNSCLFPAEVGHRLGQQIVVASRNMNAIGQQKYHEVDANTGIEGVSNANLAATSTQDVEKVSNDAVLMQSSSGSVEFVAMLKKVLANTVQIPVEEIELDRPFAEYGLDSILGVTFLTRVGESISLELNTAILFEYTTLDQLAEFLEAQFKRGYGSKNLSGLVMQNESFREAASQPEQELKIKHHAASMSAQQVKQQAKLVLAQSLQIDDSQIDDQQPFSDYGLDSILGVSFVSELSEILKIEINTAVLFEFPTLETLTDYLLSQLDLITTKAKRLPSDVFNMKNQSSPIYTEEKLETEFFSGNLSVDAVFSAINQDAVEVLQAIEPGCGEVDGNHTYGQSAVSKGAV